MTISKLNLIKSSTLKKVVSMAYLIILQRKKQVYKSSAENHEYKETENTITFLSTHLWSFSKSSAENH